MTVGLMFKAPVVKHSQHSDRSRLRQLSELSDRAALCDWISGASSLWQAVLNWGDTTRCPSAVLSNNYTGVTIESSTSRIIRLDFEQLGVVDSLPEAWSSLESLTALRLPHNGLISTLPLEWSSFRQIASLQLYGNGLHGALPCDWSTFRSLTFLDLRDNSFSGTLPEIWSTMHNLTEVLLDTNLFNGSLPAAWSTWPNISTLRLENNNLQGTLPEAWSALTGLTLLSLYQNTGLYGGKFAACVPSYPSLSRLVPLSLPPHSLPLPLPLATFLLSMFLFISRATCTPPGTIPSAWSTLVNLEQLVIHSASLFGKLLGLYRPGTFLSLICRWLASIDRELSRCFYSPLLLDASVHRPHGRR